MLVYDMSFKGVFAFTVCTPQFYNKAFIRNHIRFTFWEI